MKKFIMLIAFVLTACGGGAGGGSASVPSVDDPTAPTPPSSDEYVVPAAKPQLAFSEVSATQILARAGDAIPLSFTVINPTSEPLKCNWFVQNLPNVGLGFAGDSKHQEGVVDGPCSTQIHNQTGMTDKKYWVYINAGDLTLEYEWTVTYTASGANDAVSIVGSTTAGTYRIYDSKRFEVEVLDRDLDGVCSWRINGVEVSTSCVAYTAVAAAGTRTLTFTIDDGPTDAMRSWTLRPAAKVTALTPTSANVSNGGSQVFTATLSDPFSSGAMCEFLNNGSVAQSRGSCTYNFTGNGTSRTIKVRAVYDSGGVEFDSTQLTASALGPVNNGVSLDSFVPAHTTKMYLSTGVTSNVFGVDTWTDVDGDAYFEWYLNGVKVDCDTDARCTYTSPVVKNGIQLDNFQNSMVIKVVFTDGQYSASKTWLAHIDYVEIDENRPAVVGKAAGSEFWVYGRGFESTDTFTIQNLNIPLEKVQVLDGAVKLRTTQFISHSGANVAIRVQKSWNANQALPSAPTSFQVQSSMGVLQIGF